jgi:hypothetical protein
MAFAVAQLSKKGLALRLVLLSTGLFLPGAVAVLAVARYGGASGIKALLLALGVCWASATVALILSHVFYKAHALLGGLLMPMAVRMGWPLTVAVIVCFRNRGLVEAGFIYYLLMSYLLALALEVPLSLPRLNRQTFWTGK